MTVAYAALHSTLRYRGVDTKLYGVAFEDRTMFFSQRQPVLYDAQARPMAPREVLAGSFVNVRYRVEGGVNRMEAVQVVRLAEDEFPFDPVPDDGHL